EADALVLAAIALPVLGRAEDALAEEAVLLGLERPIVDGFRLGDLAVAPRANLLGAGEADADGVEIVDFEHGSGRRAHAWSLTYAAVARGRPSPFRLCPRGTAAVVGCGGGGRGPAAPIAPCTPPLRCYPLPAAAGRSAAPLHRTCVYVRALRAPSRRP